MMKIVTLEEHFQIPEVREVLAKLLPGTQDTPPLSLPRTQLEDLGAGRLKDMDSMDIDVQVLSYTPVGLPLVQTDGLRLEQVLVNLLNNALHYTPAQGEISISAAHVDTHLQLRVSDTGKGIPSEKLFRIWERFYQVDTARDRRTGVAGVGLGLAVCRGIITRLHGSITVESTVGKGTIFTILLPISR